MINLSRSLLAFTLLLVVVSGLAQRLIVEDKKMLEEKGEKRESGSSEVAVKLRWDDGSEILIPVKDGELQITQAKVSGRLILEAVK